MSHFAPLLASILALAACSGSAPEPAPDASGPAAIPIELALNWYPEPEFGGFYEGVLSGLYAARGFDVTIVPGGPGAPTLELLASGRADVAISAADDLLVKRHKGVKAVGAWAAFDDSPQGLMVHAGSGISGFEQIPAGAMVAIEQGSPFQQFLWRRFSWDDRVTAVPYGGAVGPFLADPTFIQQAYITAEPCAAQAKGADVTFLKAADAGWNPYGTLVAVADPAPPWTADFVAATREAWAAYRANPSRANAEIARLNDQLDAEMLACITQAQAPFLTDPAVAAPMTAERWGAVAATLVELGLLPAGQSAAGAWTSP